MGRGPDLGPLPVVWGGSLLLGGGVLGLEEPAHWGIPGFSPRALVSTLVEGRDRMMAPWFLSGFWLQNL